MNATSPRYHSKFSPPRIAGAVYRPRLIERLQENRDKKLILILGQAAQGKSTLAASYVTTSIFPYAWINLEQEDSDAAALFLLLVQSIQQLQQDDDLSHLRYLPSISMGPRSDSSLFRDWAQGISRFITGPTLIVFDGLDRLEANAGSHLLLKTLIQHLPEDVHFIMLSREAPSFDIRDLVARQDASLLTNEEIAFTLDESREFLKRNRKLSLTSDALKTVHLKTEGWIGGLVLLSDALDRLPEDVRDQYITKDLPAKGRLNVFDYLDQTIFLSRSSADRDFLVKSSILDIIDPEFMNDLCFPNTLNIVEDLAKKHLFIHSVYDENRGLVYKYHNLFKSFLRARFKASLPREEQMELHFHAGSYLEQKGETEAAIGHYLNARAYHPAVEAIKKIGLDLIRTGQNDTLSRWLRTLPGEIVQEDPWLLVYQSAIRRFTAVEENILHLKKAYERFEKTRDMRGMLLSMASLIEATFIKGSDVIPLTALVAKAEEMIHSFPTRDYPWETALLLNQIGITTISRGGDLRKSLRACQNAHHIAKSISDPILEMYALMTSYNLLSYMGDIPAAAEVRKRIIRMLAKHDQPDLRAFFQVCDICHHLLTGNKDDANEALGLLHELVEEQEVISFYPLLLIYDVVVKRVFGDYTGAEMSGNRLLEFASHSGNAFFYGNALLEMGACHYHKGDFPKAIELLERSIQIFTSDQLDACYHLNYAKIHKTMSLHHLSQEPVADTEAFQALSFWKEVSSDCLLMEAHLAIALLRSKEANTEETLQNLIAGLKIAKERGYTSHLLIRPEDVVQACILAIELRAEGVMDYALELLTTSLTPWSKAELERLSNKDERLQRFARKARRRIHHAQLPTLHIATLGGFHVRRGEAIIQDWAGHQPRRLLKAIIARGSSNVSRDVLLEDLWPDSDPALSEKRFKTQLYRLRMILETWEGKSKLGPSYVLLKDNRVSLDPGLCRIDVNEFSAYYRGGRESEKAGDLKAAFGLYQNAADIYRGEFLTDDLYMPCINEKRRELFDQHVDLLYRMAGLYERRGMFKSSVGCYHEILKRDPLAEKAYQRMIALYSDRGMKSDAIKTYEACRKALEAGLSVEPDAVTTALYRKALTTS